MTYYDYHASPLGSLLLTAGERGLTGLHIEGARHVPAIGAHWIRDAAPFAAIKVQLDEYFALKRTRFDVKTDASGSPFQRSVWSALTEIDYGATLSYGDLARRLARPRAVRAVGGANGRNPLSIVVPCHRVIGADGTLTGYAGGIAAKRYLLELESRFALAGRCAPAARKRSPTTVPAAIRIGDSSSARSDHAPKA